MNSAQAVCNYALLQFLPYPETGEFVNVGLLMMCQQPCFLHFEAERVMTGRVKAMFPRQNERTFADAMESLRRDMERAANSVRDPKTCQILFNEIVRRRESLFRFGEVRTILTIDPLQRAQDLFCRDIRMETPAPQSSSAITA
jgi:hypothetical protein